MTPDDILNLLKLVCPPSPVVSLSAPTRHIVEDLITVRPRTSPPLKTHKSTPWKRRPSAVAASIQDRDDVLDMISSTTEDGQQEDVDDQNEYHRDLMVHIYIYALACLNHIPIFIFRFQEIHLMRVPGRKRNFPN